MNYFFRASAIIEQAELMEQTGKHLKEMLQKIYEKYPDAVLDNSVVFPNHVAPHLGLQGLFATLSFDSDKLNYEEFDLYLSHQEIMIKSCVKIDGYFVPTRSLHVGRVFNKTLNIFWEINTFMTRACQSSKEKLSDNFKNLMEDHEVNCLVVSKDCEKLPTYLQLYNDSQLFI